MVGLLPPGANTISVNNNNSNNNNNNNFNLFIYLRAILTAHRPITKRALEETMYTNKKCYNETI
jgi:hypothetical protein